MAQPIYHLLPYAAWRSVDPDGHYAPGSLDHDGFVHFSGDEATVLAIANAYYHDAAEPMVVLSVDPDRLSAKVRWEPPSEQAEDQLFPHVYGPVERSAVVDVRHMRQGPDGRYTAMVHRPSTAELLDLTPHQEGGWYRETWAAAPRFVPDGYSGERPAATAILYLLRPGEESHWHRVRSDELWLWHSGGPLHLVFGGSDDTPVATERTTLSGDLYRHHTPQALVPAGTWQSARPAEDSEVLVSCVVAPGFDAADFEMSRDA